MTDLPAVIPATEEPQRLAPGGGLQVRSMDDLARMAGAVAKSGMFKDANTPERAAVKMMFAMAMGFEPITGLTGVDLIEGNPSPNGHFWAAALESHPRYDYNVKDSTDLRCVIEFYRDGELRGVVRWTMEDAKRAGLAHKDNWKKYPRAMLYNRAMAEGGRMYCPQLFGGVRAYVPEELGADAPHDPAPVSAGLGQGEQPPLGPAARPDPESPSAGARTTAGTGNPAETDSDEARPVSPPSSPSDLIAAMQETFQAEVEE